jgi:hypothetical protein
MKASDLSEIYILSGENFFVYQAVGAVLGSAIHTSSSLLASHCRSQGSIGGKSIYKLLWTK